MTRVRTLLLDNYDSFTFNLFQLLAEVNDCEPIVVRHDGATWDELAAWDYDNIVVSPGPGRPEHARDIGVCADAIRHAEAPLLGVCLGHQALGHESGAQVVYAPEVMHGRLSAVHHDGSALFAGIPQGFEAVRYHSLCVAQPLPRDLRPTAWTSDDVLMAMAHRRRLQWGVQFHPESICTEHGRRLLANFRDLTLQARRGPARSTSRARERSVVPRGQAAEPRCPLELHVERIDRVYDTEQAFVGLFGEEPYAFWLDSSKVTGQRSRFSFMGARGGPLSALVTYDVGSGGVRVERESGTETHAGTIFDHLRRELGRLGRLADDLPFDLDCGFVGYFGYELKADCGSEAPYPSSLPDAAFLFADRMVAFDHLEGRTYVLCVSEPGGGATAERWIGETTRRLAALPALAPPPLGHREQPVQFRLSRSRERYLDDIRRCQRYLREGESYEICLTNRIWADVSSDPLTLYRTLRHLNPAPFSAFLRLGDAAVLSSSPERFLRVGRDRRAEAKPIKGTTRRGRNAVEDFELAEELRTSEKNRAENLMITDLLRNDLGIVSEIGSVHVPHLFAIESFETVHQMVTTVAGRLRDDLTPVDCVQACFPGGSMTGAPKKRTLEIIDELEGEARGVYSGAIGYLGLGGAVDLNIVIRTIVLDGARASIGAGGAIVMQSDPEDEFEEMLLKANAPMRAIVLCETGTEEPQRAVAGALREG